jgi:hypothetical protein
VSLHPTALSWNVQARVLTWLASELTLPGAPRVQHAEEQRRAAEPGPLLRVTFDEVGPVYRGTFAEGLAAYACALLVTADLLWPGGATDAVTDLYAPDRCAQALRDALTLKCWSFLDYSTPTLPTTVEGARLRVDRPVRVLRLPPDAGLTRRQVRAQVEWVGRFTNAFAA